MTLPLSGFSEGGRMVALLAAARRDGLGFDQAWASALLRIRRGRAHDNERWALASAAFRHYRDAWRRAYDREPPTPLDNAGAMLARAMEEMYDDSDYAEPEWVALPEAA